MKSIEAIISSLRVAMTDARQNESHFESWMILNEAICDAIDALAEQPAQTDWEAVAADQAMTIALLRAEQPVQQEPVPCCGKYETCTQACTPRGRFLGKREAQQEPVAWMDASGDIYKHELWPNWNPPHTPLYTTSPAQQDIQRLIALVRAQQITIDKLEAQHTWVGLSSAERSKCLSAGDAHGWIGVMEATEAKLKEKNT